MTKADEYLVRDIHNILENGVMDENPRPKYADGTPAHTCFVTHVVRQYDLSKGEFPICTLRPIAYKSAIKEMLWIFQVHTLYLLLPSSKVQHTVLHSNVLPRMLLTYLRNAGSKPYPNTVHVQ